MLKEAESQRGGGGGGGMGVGRYLVAGRSGIPDQTDGIYTLFQTKMAKSIPYSRLQMLENDNLLGGTYLYG